jgi:hypothetical protein
VEEAGGAVEKAVTMFRAIIKLNKTILRKLVKRMSAGVVATVIVEMAIICAGMAGIQPTKVKIKTIILTNSR